MGVGVRADLCAVQHHGATLSALLVTIHDVTPAFMPRVQALWRQCVALGARPGLLLVPNWHGISPVEDHPAFLDWVRARAAEGAEIFLHGERHDEVGLPRGWRDEVRAFGRTNREGEFLTLDYSDAWDRIDRGLHRLRTLGLEPIGFVPPAWLAKPATHLATKDAGLAVSEDDARVFLHRSGRSLRSPVLRWSARSAARAHVSALQARVRWMLQREVPVMRIALHPTDLDHPAAAASLARSLRLWLQARALTRYAEL